MSSEVTMTPPNQKSEAVQDSAIFDIDVSGDLHHSDTNREITTLRSVVSNLTRIHLLAASKFDNYDALIKEYLLSGKEVFGLEAATVVAIDDNAGEGEIIIKSEIGLDCEEKNDYLAASEVLCRKVITSKQVIAFNYFQDSTTPKMIATFIGAPIYIGDNLYGVLAFLSVNSYRDLSLHDRNLISLMANGIGAYQLQEKEAHLTELNQKIRRFVGYVAHDLRNPLGLIIGLARIGLKPDAPQERLRQALERITSPAETALEFVNTILENAALNTGKITLDTAPVVTRSLMQSAVNDVEHFATESGNSVLIQVDPLLEQRKIVCDERRIHQTLVNLLINAIKYSPRDSTVELSVHIYNQGLGEIIINNTIDLAPSSTEGMPKLYGSVGFGLDIANDILLAHQSELITVATSNTYTVSFHLPLI